MGENAALEGGPALAVATRTLLALNLHEADI